MGPNVYSPQILSTTTDAVFTTDSVNASVTDTAASTKVVSNSVLIGVWAQPILVRWAVTASAAVDANTGFYLPANSVIALRRPSVCTHLQYLRAGGTNSNISILPIEGP